MDLPPEIAAACNTYKKHTEIVKHFIDANGGATKSPRDWEYAPYKVADRLADKGFPIHIQKSLAIAIRNRETVADHHRVHRKRNGEPLSITDLNHLSFIDKLRNIGRCWFPAGPTTKQEATEDPDTKPVSSPASLNVKEVCPKEPQPIPSNQELSISPSKATTPAAAASTSSVLLNADTSKSTLDHSEDEEKKQPEEKTATSQMERFAVKRPSNPLPGKFVFEITNSRKAVTIWHPYHATPVKWDALRNLKDVKWELRRYLRKCWPVRVLITDTLGCWDLSELEILRFAWSKELLAFAMYDRLFGNSEVMFPAVQIDRCNQFMPASELMPNIYCDSQTYLQDLRLARDESSDAVKACKADLEVFLSERLWTWINAVPFSGREFTWRSLDGAIALIWDIGGAWDLEHKRVMCSSESQTLSILVEMLQARKELIVVEPEVGEERALCSEDVAELVRTECPAGMVGAFPSLFRSYHICNLRRAAAKIDGVVLT